MGKRLRLRCETWVWGVFAVIFAAAVFLRVDFIRSVYHIVPHDSFYYDKMVRQWLETGVYGYQSETSNALVTPGYPLIMAIVYRIVGWREHDPFPYLRYLNVLISMANLTLLFGMARRWLNDGAALLAALLAAVYPAFVYANGSVLTEVPAAFLLTAYLCVQLIAFETRKLLHAGLAGALLGLTALIRPEFLPLCLPLYAVYWLLTRDRSCWKPLLVALAGLAVVMSPWWVRNAVVMDRLILAGTQTNPFYAGTFPYKNWNDGLVDGKGQTQKQIAIERLKVGFTQHTGLFLRWFTIGKLTYTYGKMFMGSGNTPAYPIFPRQYLLHLALLAFGLLGAILALLRRRLPLLLLCAVIAAMSAVRLLFIPEYRYNFTVMPLFILLAAYAAAEAYRYAASLIIRSGSSLPYRS